jgi:HlyD family secretion protein
MAKKKSKKYLTISVIVLLAALLTFAFWPRPLMVDMGKVVRNHLVITIEEEGKTRVHDTYIVSTPVAGRLLRVDVEPGDQVIGKESVVAEMLPQIPATLDARSLAEIRADIAAAAAALRTARADHDKARADKKLAEAELRRTTRLEKSNIMSKSELDFALRQAHVAEAALQAAQATIAMREAEIDNARARLISLNDNDLANHSGKRAEKVFSLYAPVTGKVLRLLQESASTLAAGTAVMEIGNVESDLEVVVELLSSDAVQVSPGNRVIFTGWGGPGNLEGIVYRIEPWGFTKISALGVEEQRVNTIIHFTAPQQAWKRLGHGFRVEAKIVVWEKPDALVVPSSALFRLGREWAVFQVTDEKATLRRVEIGQNNGIEAQVSGGLELGNRVILYPSSALTDGTKVTERKIKEGSRATQNK